VDRVSFEVGPGEIVGFLGPNGAGKSTLLKMMSTWLPPTSGHIRIAGHDVVSEPLAVRRSLGYLPEHNSLYEGMRVDRFLRFMGRARGLRGAHLAERIAWGVDACTLETVLAKRVEQCSKGFRQRIGVAAALLHDPPVLLLDEPTHGLDPLQVVAFREFLRGLREERAILFSSHILSEVTTISERLLVIHHGHLLADTTVAAMEERAAASGRALEDEVLEIVRSAEVTT
jgi:ABC-2 type transport system ATP-binding protein